MGRYEDPQMITDKRFETLNKGLSDLYSNVAKNAEAIKKRNEAKKQATLKRIEQWQKVYADKTGDSYRAALDFSETVDQDKNPNFIQNMKGTYAGGYDIIKNYIKDNPKASIAEIDNKVNELINSANSFTGGLVALGALQKENNDGIKNIAQQNGLKKGNLPGNPVIGSGYENIFEQLGVSPGQDKVDMDQLGVVGNLETGVSIFYDAPGEDGEYNNQMDEGEVLDLKVLSDQWQNGKNPYFAKTVDWNESLKTQKQILSKHEKSPLFLEEEIIKNDDGTTTKIKFINKEKRTDYFLNGEGKPVLDTYINSLQAENNRGLIGVAQSVGGIAFAKEFNADDPVHMDMLRRGVLEKMETTMYVGEGTLKIGPGGTVSTTKTYQSSGIDYASISDVNKMDHKVLNDIIPSGQNAGPFTSSQISDLNEHFKGRPYNQGTDQVNKGKVDKIVAGSNPGEITVFYATGSGQRGQKSVTYNLNDPTKRNQFETAMLRGNFPNVPAYKLSGVVKSTAEGTVYDDTKVTERVYRSERTGPEGTITEDDYKKMLEANEGQPTFDELLNNLVGDQPADASQNQQQTEEEDQVDNNATGTNTQVEEEVQVTNNTASTNTQVEEEVQVTNNANTQPQVEEEEEIVVDYTIPNQASVVSTYNSAAYQDDPGTYESSNTAQQIKDGLAEISDPSLDFEEIGMKFETLGGAATSSTGGLVGIAAYSDPKHKIPEDKKDEYKNTYDYYLNDKGKVGSKNYAGGREKHGLKVDLEVDINGTKTNVYDQLPKGAQEILRTQHFNQTWDPRYTLLMATGMVDDRSKLKDKDETDKLYKKMIKEGKLKDLDPQAVLDSYVELAKRSHDGGVRKDGLGKWYPQYVERARYLAARNGLNMPANFDKAENENYTNFSKLKFSPNFPENQKKEMKNLFRKNPELSFSDASDLVDYNNQDEDTKNMMDNGVADKLEDGNFYKDGDHIVWLGELYELNGKTLTKIKVNI